MKRIFTITSVLAACIMAAACANKNSKTPAQEPEIETETIKTAVIDGTRLTWIRDNAEERNNPVSLFAGTPQSLVDSLGLENGIPSSMSAFLVRENGHNLLFDAGMGAPNSLLLSSLDTLGVKPEDVDYIFITHMHGDHIGGLVKDGKAVFPNAKLYLSDEEQAAWVSDPEKGAAQINVLNIYNDQLNIFHIGDILPFDIRTIDAKGHTPGHTAYLIGRVLIAGDIMHGVALQMADPTLNARYDMDPEMAAKSRMRALEYAQENESVSVIAGMHFPSPGYIDFRN